MHRRRGPAAPVVQRGPVDQHQNGGRIRQALQRLPAGVQPALRGIVRRDCQRHKDQHRHPAGPDFGLGQRLDDPVQRAPVDHIDQRMQGRVDKSRHLDVAAVMHEPARPLAALEQQHQARGHHADDHEPRGPFAGRMQKAVKSLRIIAQKRTDHAKRGQGKDDPKDQGRGFVAKNCHGAPVVWCPIYEARQPFRRVRSPRLRRPRSLADPAPHRPRHRSAFRRERSTRPTDACPRRRPFSSPCRPEPA